MTKQIFNGPISSWCTLEMWKKMKCLISCCFWHFILIFYQLVCKLEMVIFPLLYFKYRKEIEKKILKLYFSKDFFSEMYENYLLKISVYIFKIFSCIRIFRFKNIFFMCAVCKGNSNIFLKFYILYILIYTFFKLSGVSVLDL